MYGQFLILPVRPKRGRPKLLGVADERVIKHMYFNELFTIREIADILKISHMTVWRALGDKND